MVARTRENCPRCMVMCGSGHKVLMPPIQDSGQHPARLVNTTESLCVTSMFCAAAPALPRFHIFVPRTATSFPLTRGGSSWACGWRRRSKMRKHLVRPARLYDFAPERGTFLNDALQGLQLAQKELPSKYFYDDPGSQLFEQICKLDEYYLTRTE